MYVPFEPIPTDRMEASEVHSYFYFSVVYFQNNFWNCVIIILTDLKLSTYIPYLK